MPSVGTDSYGSEIDELFDFLFDGEPEGKELGVLWRAYIDDSADRNREKVVISACLLGDSQQWREVVRPWRVKLAEYNLNYFKSSECGLLSGELVQFKSEENYPKPLGRQTADKVRDQLDEIIRNSSVCGFGVVIPIPDFNRVYAEPHYAALIASPDPYELAVQLLWDQCAKGMRELGRNHIVTFAHDDGDNYDRLRKLFRAYKANNPHSASRMADFVALDDKTHPTIQAADAAASVTQKFAVQWISDQNAATLDRLKSRMYRIVVSTEEWLREALDGLIELNKKSPQSSNP
jgi:hypothetical protein